MGSYRDHRRKTWKKRPRAYTETQNTDLVLVYVENSFAMMRMRDKKERHGTQKYKKANWIK